VPPDVLENAPELVSGRAGQSRWPARSGKSRKSSRRNKGISRRAGVTDAPEAVRPVVHHRGATLGCPPSCHRPGPKRPVSRSKTGHEIVVFAGSFSILERDIDDFYNRCGGARSMNHVQREAAGRDIGPKFVWPCRTSCHSEANGLAAARPAQ